VTRPKAFNRPDEFADAVARVEPMLAPEVVRLRHSLGDDWTGEPAVFFLVTLSDATASRVRRLENVTWDISEKIRQEIEPQEEWGVYPYFSYRSESEQAVIQDKAWA
jgi:hypothetical protein